jgi:putative ABC transport system permease protein
MVAARLKAGVSMQAASAALSTVKIAGLPDWAVESFQERQPALIGMASIFDRTSYWFLFAGGALLYVCACLNGMNLMLARLVGRQRELGIRLSLGSTRWQSARLLLLEGMILALVAGIAAGLLWFWSYPTLTELFSGDHSVVLWTNEKWWWPVSRVWFGLLGALSVFAGIAITSIPVWRVMHGSRNASLGAPNGTYGETRKIGRVRDGLVILQGTFAVILLVGTGLMVRTFERIHQLDLGFNAAGMVNVRFSFPADFQPPPDAKLALFERLCAGLEKLPGVKGAAYGVGVLMTAEWHGAKVKLPDGTERDVSGQQVSANFAEVAGLTMVKGRWFSDKRIRNEAVSEAVINERMARELYGDRNPLGEFTPDRHYVVVGVVRDLRGELRTPAGLHFYFPAWLHPDFLANITLRLKSEPTPEFSGLVQRTVYAMEPRLIVPNVTSVNESIVMSTWSERLAYSMLKALTPLASALALAGLFSVLAYNVECRRKEFGVRLALGASPMKLIRLVLKRGLVTAGAGVFTGSICSVGLTRFIRGLLFETAPYDPLVYLMVASGLLTAATVACWLPARRAARVDPVISLRSE